MHTIKMTRRQRESKSRIKSKCNRLDSARMVLRDFAEDVRCGQPFEMRDVVNWAMGELGYSRADYSVDLGIVTYVGYDHKWTPHVRYSQRDIEPYVRPPKRTIWQRIKGMFKC